MKAWHVALAFALACGGGEPESDADATEVGTTGGEVAIAPPPPLDPLAFLPADSLAVITVDVGRLRTSPYYPTIHGWLELVDELSPTQREGLDAAILGTEVAHISMVQDRCSRPCWTVGSFFLGGSMEPSAANATLQQVANAPDFGPREVGGYAAYGNAQGALVTLESGKYLLGPHRFLETPLAQPRRPDAESNAAVASAVQALAGGESMIRGWIIGDETTQGLLARETPFTDRVTSLVQGAAYRVDLANGLQLDIVATTADPANAATLADALRREVDALTSGLPARAMGIHVLGESTQIRVQGAEVHVSLQLNDDQLQSLLRRADGLLRLVN